MQVYRPQSHPELSVVLFADRSYPRKAAYSICIRAMFAFTQTFAPHEYVIGGAMTTDTTTSTTTTTTRKGAGMVGMKPGTTEKAGRTDKWKWPLLEECLRECNDPETVLRSIQGDDKTRKELEATTEIKVLGSWGCLSMMILPSLPLLRPATTPTTPATPTAPTTPTTP